MKIESIHLLRKIPIFFISLLLGRKYEMSKNEPPEIFGCEHCWPQSAEVAEAASIKLQLEAELIDESHFIVSIRRCSACLQSFVSVFTERINWDSGRDPCHRQILPIKPEDAAQLLQQGDSLSWATLEALGPDRRSLHYASTSDGAKRFYWSYGIRIDVHD